MLFHIRRCYCSCNTSRGVLRSLYTLWKARLGSSQREGLDISLEAFRPCANHLVLRVKEGAGEIAMGGRREIHGHMA